MAVDKGLNGGDGMADDQTPDNKAIQDLLECLAVAVCTLDSRSSDIVPSAAFLVQFEMLTNQVLENPDTGPAVVLKFTGWQDELISLIQEGRARMRGDQ